MDSFIYCWTDHRTNKLYVGSHKGSIDDGYICSSKYMMEEYEKRPEDFTRQIIANGNFKDIRFLEVEILKSVNARLNEDFYNKHNGDGKFYCHGHTEESKQKLSKAHKGKKLTFTHKEKLSKVNKDYMKSDSYRQIMSNIGKQRKHSIETRKKIARKGIMNGMFGRSIVKEKNLKWYTNGVNSIYVTEGTQPNGYISGRKKRINKC